MKPILVFYIDVRGLVNNDDIVEYLKTVQNNIGTKDTNFISFLVPIQDNSRIELLNPQINLIMGDEAVSFLEAHKSKMEQLVATMNMNFDNICSKEG